MLRYDKLVAVRFLIQVCACVCVLAAVDEQNAQTQQQLFSLSRDEEEDGLVEEDEEETEEDKMSLQSSYSVKRRNTRRGQWCCYADGRGAGGQTDSRSGEISLSAMFS